MSALRKSSLLAIVAIVALALNLRPVLAGIGPLLSHIQKDIALSSSEAGLLTALPVCMMGVCAFFGKPLLRALGLRLGVGIGCMMIAAACALRMTTDGRLGLLATAMLAGVGIALIQVLLPIWIKQRFSDQVGRVFGLYVTGIMGGAAIAAASVAQLATWWHWTGALALWALPALCALPLWLLSAPRKKEPACVKILPSDDALPLWKAGRAWTLMLFFGTCTGAYTLVLMWLPPFYVEQGWSSASGGLLLSALTCAEVAAGLIVSSCIGRFPDRRVPLCTALLLLMAGLACLIGAPTILALPACALLGLGIGALFPLSLIVTLDHVDDPERAGMLAAFVQGGGYVIASVMPLFAGVLRDALSGLEPAWGLMLMESMALLLLCLRFSPASYARASIGRQACNAAK